MASKTKSIKSTKIKSDKHGKSIKLNESVEFEKVLKENKHIKFDDDDDECNDGDIIAGTNEEISNKNCKEKKQSLKKSEKNRKNAMDIGTHWYQVVSSCLNELSVQNLGRCTNIFSIFSLLSIIVAAK